MAFQTDSDVEETTDTSTSFTHKSSSSEYSETTAERTSGVGTTQGDSADEINPRRLMADPAVNDIRWLYRMSLAETLVDKPIDDVFKHGFEIRDEEGEREDVGGILDKTDWEEHYKDVQKKARRDGFALTFFNLDDNSAGVWEDPLKDSVTVKSVNKLVTLTIDDLSRYRTSRPSSGLRPSIEEATGKEHDEYEIRKTGIVVDTDPQSSTYKEPLGYLVGPDQFAGNHDDIKFIHQNRIHHHTWNAQVDGDLDKDTYGEYEGDSVLLSSYHILRGMQKGNWSLMQTLFRYASKLYHVEMPEDANEDDFDEATAQLQNLNAKSEIITPHGYEMDDFQTDGQLDPQPYFEVLFEQVCASNEMTKSVLFGTQSGTVSGSETDIKNYFNKIERMRENRVERDMKAFVTRYKELVDGRTGGSYSAEFEIEWGPLFKLNALDKVEVLNRTMQVLSSGVNDFILTPMEARSILQEEWADANVDWEDEFSAEEKEWLESLNVHQQGGETAEEKAKGSTQQQNGGGMQKGQQTASNQPNTDAEDALIDALESEGVLDTLAEELADRASQRLTENDDNGVRIEY